MVGTPNRKPFQTDLSGSQAAVNPGEFSNCMSTMSPLTGVIEETDVIVDFGQYEGQSVSQVKNTDPDLYQQLVQEKENDNIAIRRNKDKTFRLYMNPLLARAN